MAGTGLVQSLTRALDILEAVGRSESEAGGGGGATLKGLSDSLGLKGATVHNLAKTLVARRYLTKRNGGYRLGPAAPELAQTYLDSGLSERAQAEVTHLAEEFPAATVVFSRPAGGAGSEVLYALRMSPERPGVLERPRALAVHPYGTASALLFQALWTDEERSEYRRRHPFWEAGGPIWRDEARLDEQLAAIRRAGYARPRPPGRHSRPVAAPVWGRGRELVAAIGASVPAAEATKKEMTRLAGEVRRAAEILSYSEGS